MITFFLCGEGARRADGGHHAFGAGTQHAEHLDRGHVALNQLCQFQFVFVEQPGDRPAVLQQFKDFLAHGRVVAAEDGRAARLQKVDVLIAVHIPHVRAARFLDRQRERIIERQVVLHAAGDDLLGFFDQRFRFDAFRLEVIQEVLHPIALDGPHRLLRQFLQACQNFVGVGIFRDGILLR